MIIPGSFLTIPDHNKEHFDGQECPVIDRNLSEIIILSSNPQPPSKNDIELKEK